MTTLHDVVEQLKINNEGIQKTSSNLESFLSALERQRLDDLEDRKKAARAVKTTSASTAATKATGGGRGGAGSIADMLMVGSLLSPGGLIASLLAGTTAVVAAFEGLRGWEIPVLKNIGLISEKLRAVFPTSLSDAIKQKFVNVRAGILKTFGLSADLKVMPGAGKVTDTTLKTPILTQINDHFKKVKADFLLKYFGIGYDGKPTVKITGGGKVWLKAEEAVDFLLKPLKALAGGAAAFKTTALGIFIVDTFGKGGKVLAGITKLFTRILWPIGILMSLFEGVKAYQETEGTQYEKIKAGISTSIADFIGAPLNLLKDVVSWGLKKMGFEEQADWIDQNLDFEKSIRDLIEGLFENVEKTVEWVGTLVTDPGEALDQLLKGLLGGVGSMVDFIFNKMVAPVVEWVASKFGVDMDLPELNLQKEMTETYEKIKVSFLTSMEKMVIWFKTMPEEMTLNLKELWVEAVADLKKGFVRFGNWISNLPNALLASATGKMISAFEGDDGERSWAAEKLGLYAMNEKALAALDGNMLDQSRIQAIDDAMRTDLSSIELERQALEARRQSLIAETTYLSQQNNSQTNINTSIVDGVVNPADNFDPIGGAGR